MNETFIFTPVIRGPHNSDDAADGMLRCDVHVGVRLMPDAPTSFSSEHAPAITAFPTFANWPLSMPALFISLQNGAPVEARVLTPAPSQALWNAFFPPNTQVLGYGTAGGSLLESNPKYRWFDAAAVNAKVQEHYTSVAQQFIQPRRPTLPQPTHIVVKQGSAFTTEEALIHDGAAIGAVKVAPAEMPAPDPDLLHAYDFFHTPAPGPLGATGLPDVHNLIAYLHETPAALRALGLIIEIEVPRPTALAEKFEVVLTPHFPPGYNPSVLTPTVSYAAADITRTAAFEPSGNLQVFPYDPMHAAHVYSAYTGGSLPALRSSGVSVMRVPATNLFGTKSSGNVARILSRLNTWAPYEASLANPSANPSAALPPLAISDLVRGHRLDVWDGKAWRSLCRVTGTVARNGQSINIDDEGVISSSVAVDPDGTVRANDTLAYWNGWSLCAQRPGKVVAATAPVAPSGSAPSGLQITRSPAANSLPVLRFGNSYRFRARMVDIAGNSVSLPGESVTTDFEQSTDAQTFLRLEPVGSPATAFASPPGAGESSTQIVVRSLAAPDGALQIPPLPSTRYVFPPATTVEMAEKHGVFDTPAGLPDPEAYQRIQSKLGSLWNPSSSQPMPVTTFPAKADIFAAQTHAGGTVTVPYLPDPACEGFALIAVNNGAAIGLQDGAQIASSFLSTGAYPANYVPATLHLTPGAAGAPGSATTNSAGGPGIEIVIPPGERITVGLASTIADSAAGHLALPQWVASANSGSMPGNYMQNAQAGLIPAVTPNREISLIHAVQQPLSPAVLTEEISFVQAQGDLVSTFAVKLSCDVKTTASVTLEAGWTEWIDGGPGTPAPGPKSITAHIATLSGSALANGGQLGNRYVFGDTKGRSSIAVNTIAASSFAEFYPGADCTLRSTTASNTSRPATQPPSAPRLAYAIPAFKWTRVMQSQTGPFTSTRQGNALRIYLERPWYTSGDGELLAILSGPNTIWGSDPLSPGPAPAGSRFANQPGMPIGVQALYPVEYDAVTDRYFSDITFDSTVFGGAYKPFVQLEIAAYQPNAVAGCQLSTSVVVPFTQILPDRTLTVALSQDPVNGTSVTVSLKGLGPTAASGTYTSDVGRGISTLVDISVSFGGITDIENPLGESKGSTSDSDTSAGAVSNPPAAIGSNPDTAKMPDKLGGTVIDGILNVPPPPGSLQLKPQAAPTSVSSVPQRGISETGNPFTASPGAGYKWVQASVLVSEWELMSPDQQALYPAGSGIAYGSLPGGIPDSSPYTTYEFTPLTPRPCRLVYSENVTIFSGFEPGLPPFEPLKKF